MKDTQITQEHPLIDLLNLEGYYTLSAAENLSVFTDLKTALIADRQPIHNKDSKGTGSGLQREIGIADSESLWDAQNELLEVMVEGYACNVLANLFSALNALSDEESLFVEMDDLNKLNIPHLSEWASGFNGDFDTLNHIRSKWTHVIKVLNIESELDNIGIDNQDD